MDVTIGGLPGKAFDQTNEIDASACDDGNLRTYTFASRWGSANAGTGERQRFYVMEVQGTRLMIMTYYFSDETGSTDASEAARLASSSSSPSPSRNRGSGQLAKGSRRSAAAFSLRGETD